MCRSYIAGLCILLAAAAFIWSFRKDGATPEDTELDQLITEYQQAFKEHNSEKLASLWTEDAIYVNLSTHDTVQGRKEIEDFFKDEFENDGDVTLQVTVDERSFTDQNKAREKGHVITTVKGESLTSTFAAEFVKQDGKWLIQRVFEVNDTAPPTHYEQLKNLDWMIGQWSTKTENFSFSSASAWDTNKNFISSKTVVSFLGEPEFDVQQIIAWDPFQKKIRSWIFDTDGGFGEGTWINKGDVWYVSLVFTLPDGRKATSTQIYKKIDNNNFTFASEDRDIDGKMLPNIQPIEITRTK